MIKAEGYFVVLGWFLFENNIQHFNTENQNQRSLEAASYGCLLHSVLDSVFVWGTNKNKVNKIKGAESEIQWPGIAVSPPLNEISPLISPMWISFDTKNMGGGRQEKGRKLGISIFRVIWGKGGEFSYADYNSFLGSSTSQRKNLEILKWTVPF